LRKNGQIEESARHHLAGMIYFLVTNNQQHLGTTLRNLAIRLQEAAETGTPYPLPRLADLLRRPEFSALRRFLDKWQVNLTELQEAIDGLVEEVRDT
jgi:hypothetical protein